MDRTAKGQGLAVTIELRPEVKDALIASIKRYFAEHWEQEIGDLKASLLLQYVLAEVGPAIYNRGVVDAQTRMSEMVDEIDAVCYEPELGFWRPS